MESIQKLRKSISELRITENSSRVYIFKNYDIDWNVYLPSIGKNLQRDFVWNLQQKQELIKSVLIGRHIPHCAIINCINPKDHSKDIYQIIDGKQRLSTIFDYLDDKFSINVDCIDYLFSNLPHEYQIAISKYDFRYYVLNEYFTNDSKRIDTITDEQKIDWFRFINFAGTAQDVEHINGLININ